MTATGRVFNPCDIGDHLDEEQLARFATLLAECIERGYGQVAITVVKHRPYKVIVRFDEILDGGWNVSTSNTKPYKKIGG